LGLARSQSVIGRWETGRRTRSIESVAAAARACELEADGIEVQAASLADVIRSMEAAGRERDRQALPTLRRLLERLDEGDEGDE